MTINRREFVVPQNQSGMRIDLVLAAALPDLSRRKVRQILDVGGCYVNNKRMHIASRKVFVGDKIRLEFSVEGLKAARQKSFSLSDHDILYDNYDIIAINKPPGLPSQATRDQDVVHAEVCLREWLAKHKRKGEPLILCHRLDKETSGVLVFATSTNAATWITDQFRSRSLHKTYWALCRGFPKESKFELQCYLSEIDKKTGRVVAVQSGGKPSKTLFVMNSFRSDLGVSWFTCHPETGRSHQIRVHLEMAGLPILGDKRYGKGVDAKIRDDISLLASHHHMLHARSLEFTPAPNLASVVVEASPPAKFNEIIGIISAER
jgi:23S rRNA pseudouridine1911/1915/1917 synthase